MTEKMTKENFNQVQEAGKTLCNCCTDHECADCKISKLIAKAYVTERLFVGK